jgi:hypothetical protein
MEGGLTTLLEVVEAVSARIVRAREFAGDGEIDAALTVLEDLELDVERALAEYCNIAPRKSEAA